jgi:peptidase C25-like protein
MLVVAARGAALGSLRPLLSEHARVREVRVVDPGPVEVLCEAVAGAEGLLLVDDRRRAPRTALPGPFLVDPSGRAVPAGWLPDLGSGLDVFAKAAARVQRRSGPPGPLAVLGQWEPRYIQLAGRLEANLSRGGQPPFPVLRWTSERITRSDLVAGLRLGLGVGIYFGHGRPKGWAGYHGLRASHLVEAAGEPLGALFSVTCLTANRWRVGLSFSEAVVTGGAAAAAVGAVDVVAHVDNMRWMLGLADSLRSGESRLGPALLAASTHAVSQTPYRIIGDPLALLAGTAEGARRAERVFAPAPELAA